MLEIATLRGLALSILALHPAVPASSTAEQRLPARAEVFQDFQVILYVADVRRSVSFYTDSLGFQLHHYLVGSAKEVTELAAGDPEPYAAELVAGNQHIGLQRNGGEVRLPASGARYHFEVPDPASYYSRLLSHGITVHHMIKTTNGQPFMFSVTDPDGHWIFFRGPIGRR